MARGDIDTSTCKPCRDVVARECDALAELAVTMHGDRDSVRILVHSHTHRMRLGLMGCDAHRAQLTVGDRSPGKGGHHGRA